MLDDDNFVVHPKELIHFRHPSSKPSKKVLALDLDNTLIRRREDSSGKAGLPDDKEDFELYNPRVKEVLKDYAKKGYALVVMSNQGGIKTAMGGITSFVVRGVCANVGKALGDDVALNFILATAAPDKARKYRKPQPGMWRAFVELINDGVEPDLADCLYVGDAAGRPQDIIASKINDGDKQFAEAVGIAFKTPEEVFGVPGKGKEENQAMGNAFMELANLHAEKTESDKKFFKAKALRVAGGKIKMLEKVVRSVEDVDGVKGIGKMSKELVAEFLETGGLAEIEKINSGEYERERKERAENDEKEISKAAQVRCRCWWRVLFLSEGCCRVCVCVCLLLAVAHSLLSFSFAVFSRSARRSCSSITS